MRPCDECGRAYEFLYTDPSDSQQLCYMCQALLIQQQQDTYQAINDYLEQDERGNN